jgi:hypothetical protein
VGVFHPSRMPPTSRHGQSEDLDGLAAPFDLDPTQRLELNV